MARLAHVHLTAVFLMAVLFSPHTPKSFNAVLVGTFDVAPLAVMPLSLIVGDAETDAALLFAGYYEAHRDMIRVVLNEANDERLRGLFAMYLSHLAVPYGASERPYPVNVHEFLRMDVTACAAYSDAVVWMAAALGVRGRLVTIDEGWHTVAELWIGGRWEVFDATANVWVSVSVEELLAGAERQYREMYTPIADPRADYRYRAHIDFGWDVLGLRAGLSQWGLTVFPSHWRILTSGWTTQQER